MHHLKQPHQILWLALFCGWSADQLFYGKAAGLSALLFAGLVWSGLRLLAHRQELPPNRRASWLAVPLFASAAMVMVRDNPLLTFLNISATAFFLILTATFYTFGNPIRSYLFEYAILPLRALGSIAERPVPLVRDHVDLPALHALGRLTVYPVLRGAIIAVPPLLVFGGLLAAADVLFAQTLLRLLSIDIDWRLLEYPWRLVLILLLSWPAAGWLLYALRPAAKPEKGLIEKLCAAVADLRFLGPGETLTVITLVNLLFALFVYVQFTYLFGGEANINAGGFTYSEYSRRGFFELLAVAGLALAFIQTLHQITRLTSRPARLAFNAMGTAMIGFVLVMLVSAFARLLLYEYSYGFTELRLYTHVAIIWLAFLLLWAISCLWLRPERFALGVLIAGFGFTTTLNALNPDAFIVRRNLERYATSGHLDVHYLGQLSADAIPALLDTLQTLENGTAQPPPCTDQIGCYPEKLAGELHQLLADRQTALITNPKFQSWPAFHLARSRAHAQLRERFPLPPTPPTRAPDLSTN